MRTSMRPTMRPARIRWIASGSSSRAISCATSSRLSSRHGPASFAHIAALVASGSVALLIDNRTNTASDVAEAMAVTVIGRAGEATGAEREQLLALLLARHPGLADFARAVDTAVVAVRVERYLLVDRFQRVRVLAADDLD